MAIIATAKSDGKDFQPAPTGVHQAVCVDVVDLGMLDVTWQGKSKQQHKINVAWQIDEPRDDGKPFLVFKRYTLSLSEKANLRKDVEAWLGRSISRDEEMGFDVESLIGRNCLLNVTHNVSGDKTYANVASIMPLAKGMKPISVRDYIRKVDRPADSKPTGDDFDQNDQPFSPTSDEPEWVR